MFELELDWVESNLFRKLLKLICTFARELLPRKTWADLDNLERSGEYEGKKNAAIRTTFISYLLGIDPAAFARSFLGSPRVTTLARVLGPRRGQMAHTLTLSGHVGCCIPGTEREESLNRSNCFLAWAGARWPQQNWVPVAKSIRNSADRVKQFIYI